MTIPQESTADLEALALEECVRLLASAGIGRVAVAEPGEPPLVVPVNYVMDGEVVVFRSGAGTKLAAAQRLPISFQVDAIDPFHRTGWSVLVQGLAYEATAAQVAHLSLEPWIAGAVGHWIRLLPARVTGRRIPSRGFEPDPHGYM